MMTNVQNVQGMREALEMLQIKMVIKLRYPAKRRPGGHGMAPAGVGEGAGEGGWAPGARPHSCPRPFSRSHPPVPELCVCVCVPHYLKT